MKRRDFIKGTAAAAAVIVASKGHSSFASDEEYFKLKNHDNPSELEQKHVPAVMVPADIKSGDWFDVKVKIGYKMEHPSTPQHWITSIRLRVDGIEVASAGYPMGGVASPEAIFRIRLEKSAELEAIENCNLHGTWISEPLKVKVS